MTRSSVLDEHEDAPQPEEDEGGRPTGTPIDWIPKSFLNQF